jgi:hypothetical protein
MALDEADWVLAQKTMTQSKTYTILRRETTNTTIGKVIYKMYGMLQGLRKA